MIEQFIPGDVVICINSQGAPPLRKGLLYRIERRVECYNGYTLEGVQPPPPYAGYRGDRFTRAPRCWTRHGPIRRRKPLAGEGASR